MQIGLNLLTMNNSQPLRFRDCCGRKPRFEASNKNPQNSKADKDNVDYKKLYYIAVDIIANQKRLEAMKKQ